MKPSDKDPSEWKSELSSSPFSRNGFTEELRRSIEARMDAEPERKRPRFAVIGGWCAAFVLLAAIVVPRLVPETLQHSTQKDEQSATEVIAQDSKNDFSLRSALLIGLRADETAEYGSAEAEVGNSEYRTLLIAPENGRLQITAEGDGLLVPYGQAFWKLDSFKHETKTDSIQSLSIHPAMLAAEPIEPEDDPNAREIKRERVLFAGNKYISVEEVSLLYTKKQTKHSAQVWVKTLEPDEKRSKPYISVKDVFGEAAETALEAARFESQLDSSKPSGATRVAGEQWAIVRKQGVWSAQAADTFTAADQSREVFELRDLNVTLPDEIVSHDSLCCAWSEIEKVEPDALDALSSPAGDIVVILTKNKIAVYPLKDGKLGSEPLLEAERAKNESLVMAQWSLGQYIPIWMEKADLYLE